MKNESELHLCVYFYPSLDRLGLIPACIFFQHDDDDDPEDIPTEDLPIGKSSVGVLGA